MTICIYVIGWLPSDLAWRHCSFYISSYFKITTYLFIKFKSNLNLKKICIDINSWQTSCEFRCFGQNDRKVHGRFWKWSLIRSVKGVILSKVQRQVLSNSPEEDLFFIIQNGGVSPSVLKQYLLHRHYVIKTKQIILTVFFSMYMYQRYILIQRTCCFKID